MSRISCEVGNICRFCLCQDVNLLRPLSTMLDASFTIQDIERYTEIRIPEEEQTFYAICEICCYILETSTTFRYSCVSNDILFNQFTCAFVEDCTKEFNVAEPIDQMDKKATSLEIEIILPDDLEEEYVNYSSNNDDYDKTSVASIDEWYGEDSDNALHDESTVATAYSDQDPSSIEIIRQPGTKKSVKNGKKKSGKSTEQASKTKSKKLCGFCGVFVTDLISHVRIHTKDKFLTCSLCPRKMASRANLWRHVQAVHAKKIIKSCEYCGKGCTSSNSYKSHMRSHHGIGKTYECKICLKTFNHPSNYKEHFNRFHHTKIDFKCRICGKLFKDRSGLRGHRKVHSSSKPFRCNECPKRFKTRYARNTHQITHSGIRFSCTMCTKSYQYKSLLTTHFKKHHANKEQPQTIES